MVVILLAMPVLFVEAQSKKQPKKSAPAPSDKSQKQLEDELAKSRAEVIKAAAEYKESLEKLLGLIEAEIKTKREEVEKRKKLFEEQIVSKREVEQGEQELLAVQAKAAQTQSKIGEVDTLVAEVLASEQLIKLPAPRTGAYISTTAIIRYSGGYAWTIADTVNLQTFFSKNFGRALPISSYGQTATHDRLGFDHRNAIDVAVHPDTAEGRALMDYLRNVGIPFIAFRHAVAGSATGAHIHVGPPSKRFAR